MIQKEILLYHGNQLFKIHTGTGRVLQAANVMAVQLLLRLELVLGLMVIMSLL